MQRIKDSALRMQILRQLPFLHMRVNRIKNEISLYYLIKRVSRKARHASVGNSSVSIRGVLSLFARLPRALSFKSSRIRRETRSLAPYRLFSRRKESNLLRYWKR